MEPRRSGRTPPIKALPNRLQSLFHSKVEDMDNISLPKNTTLICKDPPLYYIKDFLSANDLLHFDALCTEYGSSFGNSFVEDENNKEILSEYRTSTFIHLSKSQDTVIRYVCVCVCVLVCVYYTYNTLHYAHTT